MAEPYYALTPPADCTFLMGDPSVTEVGIREGMRRLAVIAHG